MLSLSKPTQHLAPVKGLSLIILLGICLLPVPAQVNNAREIVFPVTIEWNPQRGVSRYRLQIAADERFQDVFFDARVSGKRYLVSALPPGFYYWRVASAESRLGAFSTPVRFFISGGVVTPVQPSGVSGKRTLRPGKGR